MKVLLQSYNDRGMPILKASQVKPRKEVFEQALSGMKVPQEVIDRITILIEFRFMIPDGGMVILGNDKFHIYLRSQQTWRCTLNEVVAHELKHVAIEIKRPKRFRTDGKKRGPYKWEEINCERAERRWGHLEFFTFSP